MQCAVCSVQLQGMLKWWIIDKSISSQNDDIEALHQAVSLTSDQDSRSAYGRSKDSDI